jgi:small ligand-binding sensory domain FIST
MKWGSATSVRPSAADAVAEAADRARAALGGREADLAFVFLAGHASEQEASAAARLPDLVRARDVVGCAAGGVVGGGREIERRRAVGVTLAALPPGGYRVFHAAEAALPDDDAPPEAWERLVGLPAAEVSGFVLLAAAHGDALNRLMDGLDFAYPDAPKIGGLESGNRAPGRGRLFCGGRFEPAGVVGVAFSRSVRFVAAVAQGARPFGAVGTVTRSDGHFVREIDRAPALDYFRTQLATLDDTDQRRPLGAVCVGLEADPFRGGEPAAGEYLIRQLFGAEEASGAVALGDEVRAGRRVRLHLRDAAAGEDDLRSVLRARLAPEAPFAGALLFSCVGRGAAFFGESDHDSRVFREVAGDAPLGGFFCDGEIGPVGPRTYVHAYTSTFAAFAPASPET